MGKKAFMGAIFIVILTSTAMTQLYIKEVSGNFFNFSYGGVRSPDANEEPPYLHFEFINETVAYKDGKLLGTFALHVYVERLMEKDAFTMFLELKSVSYNASWLNQSVVLYSTPNNYEPPYCIRNATQSIDHFFYILVLTGIPEGIQRINVTVTEWGIYLSRQGPEFYLFSLASTQSAWFVVKKSPPPIISDISLKNKTYNETTVPLIFNVNQDASSSISSNLSGLAYSLDNQANSTITGNTTLTGLSSGMHNITIYAWDEAENVGVSETVFFTVATPTASPTPEPTVVPTLTPSPTSGDNHTGDFTLPMVLAVLVVILVAVAVGLLVYFRKRKRS